MSASAIDGGTNRPLREQAVARLRDTFDPPIARSEPGMDALTVLYNLASDPVRAGDALKMLHELQVHQVELDVQHEQMERTRTELTTVLERYVALFDFAPVGYFTIDSDARIAEANHAGAALLVTEVEDLRGRLIESLVVPAGRPAVCGLLARVRTTGVKESCEASLQCSDGSRRISRIEASLSPRGDFVLLAMVELSNIDT